MKDNLYRFSFSNPSCNGIVWSPFTKRDFKYLSIDVPKSQMKSNFHGEDAILWNEIIPTLEQNVNNCN